MSRFGEDLNCGEDGLPRANSVLTGWDNHVSSFLIILGKEAPKRRERNDKGETNMKAILFWGVIFVSLNKIGR